MPWPIIEAIVTAMVSCGLSEPIATEGNDTATSISHANKAITRMQREARKVRMESGEDMVASLSPHAGMTQWVI
jgi:hypothetical protein